MATIQGVYVALFGRPADPAGLAYFNGVTNEGKDLSQIANLAGQKEFTDRFAGQSNVQIVNSIYQSLFNRDAESAGLNFFVGELVAGRLNINNVAIAILDSAQNADKTIVTNKIAAADLFTKSLDTPVEIAAYSGAKANAVAASWLSTVTTTAAKQADVDTTITKVIAEGAKGNTIALTAANDTLDLTNGLGTPAVTTTNNNDTINAATAGHWDPVNDKIDGGLGVDTLNATINGLVTNAVAPAVNTGVIAANGLKNVEILNLKAITGPSAVNVGNAKQLTQVWNDASAVNLTVQGIAASTTVGVKGAVTAGATTTFEFADTAGTNTANVAFNGATTNVASVVTIADTEIVNITNTGSSTIGALDVASAQSITVGGAGSLNLGVVANAVTASVDAADFAGNLTFSSVALTALKTLNGGSGNDTLTVGLTTQNLAVNAGAGNDTINVSGGNGAATKTISLTGGEGSDIFVLGSNAAVVNNVTITDNAALLNSLVIITDFNKAQDAIKVNFADAAPAWDKLLDAEIADVAASDTLLEAATKAAGYTTANQGTVFNFGGDAYIFVQNNAVGLEGGEGLIKVTGASIEDFTATNFQVF